MLKRKAIITGDILKEKASKLWRALPQYEGIEEPKWSNGWLGRFKGRFKIKEYVQHGEAASAEVDQPKRIQQIEDLSNSYSRILWEKKQRVQSLVHSLNPCPKVKNRIRGLKNTKTRRAVLFRATAGQEGVKIYI
jgi:hypothetical protein